MSTDMNYRIGVDVGDRSVGLAAIEFDDAGFPIRDLALVTYLHDGGMDPTTNKSPKSRKETAGVARRTMRMRRRKKQRLKKLDNMLRSLGYYVPYHYEEPQTYEAWESRYLLATERLTAGEELEEHLVRALRHMARHRGWRSPWWTLVQLETASQEPSQTFINMHEKALEKWAGDIPTDPAAATIGMFGALAARNDVLLRPRTYKHNEKSGKNAQKLNVLGREPVLFAKVRQEDLLAELRLICKVQEIEDQYEVLKVALFEQIRPYVPSERVGRDPLQRQQMRALRASLEFQQYRILDALANLRVRDKNGKRKLTEAEYHRAVKYLFTYDGQEAPTWGDVAEELEIEPVQLIAPVFDDIRLNKAPYDRSCAEFTKLPKKSEIRRWWDSTGDRKLKSLFVQLIADATDETLQLAEEAGLIELLESFSDKEREDLEKRKFESGRAAYSIDTLEKLSDYMYENRVGVHEARKAVFGVDDSWTPPKERLDEPTGQPTVDRVLTIVRRFILDCDRHWGKPSGIVIEHVRTGLMGPTQRAEVLREIQKNRNDNDKIRKELKDGGINNPHKSDVRRHRIVQEQECLCLYCGTKIRTDTSELDHIVPRAGGGSSRRENLAAVCRDCNSDKGGLLFADWAKNTRRPVSLEETLKRLRGLGAFKTVKNRRLCRLITRRLQQRQQDDPIDERSLASTAYSARAIRERIEQYFTEKYGETFRVSVYSGSMTRESRRAGGIDEALFLRGQRDKNRFDVRHHPIDAATLTLLNPSVALTLEQRRLMKMERDLSSRDNDWKDFTGLKPAAREKFAHWKRTAQALAEVLGEVISEDAIPVINPLRLRVQNGAVHDDTIRSVLEHAVGATWSAEALQRIVDWDIYLAFKELVGKDKELPADNTRRIALPDGSLLHADDTVQVFPGKAASILTPRGSAEIGGSIHHARLYAWKDRKGAIEVGMQRVFGAEFPELIRRSGVKDLLKVPIHPGSQSYRDLTDTVRKNIESGAAVEIGWLTQNDEIELCLDEVYAKMASSKEFISFLNLFPENRWRVDGIMDNSRVRMRPLLLAQEGIPKNELSEDNFLLVENIFKRGALVNTKALLSIPSTKIIRRNNLGVPRWRGNGYRPTSLDIQAAARRALGE